MRRTLYILKAIAVVCITMASCKSTKYTDVNVCKNPDYNKSRSVAEYALEGEKAVDEQAILEKERARLQEIHKHEIDSLNGVIKDLREDCKDLYEIYRKWKELGNTNNGYTFSGQFGVEVMGLLASRDEGSYKKLLPSVILGDPFVQKMNDQAFRQGQEQAFEEGWKERISIGYYGLVDTQCAPLPTFSPEGISQTLISGDTLSQDSFEVAYTAMIESIGRWTELKTGLNEQESFAFRKWFYERKDTLVVLAYQQFQRTYLPYQADSIWLSQGKDIFWRARILCDIFQAHAGLVLMDQMTWAKKTHSWRYDKDLQEMGGFQNLIAPAVNFLTVGLSKVAMGEIWDKNQSQILENLKLNLSTVRTKNHLYTTAIEVEVADTLVPVKFLHFLLSQNVDLAFDTASVCLVINHEKEEIDVCLPSSPKLLGLSDPELLLKQSSFNLSILGSYANYQYLLTIPTLSARIEGLIDELTQQCNERIGAFQKVHKSAVESLVKSQIHGSMYPGGIYKINFNWY